MAIEFLQTYLFLKRSNNYITLIRNSETYSGNESKI